MPFSLETISVPAEQIKKGAADFTLSSGESFEIIAGDEKFEVEVPEGKVWTFKLRVVVNVSDA